MMKRLFYGILFGAIASLTSFTANAQDDLQTFRNFQFSFNRVSQAWMKFNDSLRKDFTKKQMAFPPKDIYLRAFKSHNEMELWARDTDTAEYTLVKTYRICALSGVCLLRTHVRL